MNTKEIHTSNSNYCNPSLPRSPPLKRCVKIRFSANSCLPPPQFLPNSDSLVNACRANIFSKPSSPSSLLPPLLPTAKVSSNLAWFSLVRNCRANSHPLTLPSSSRPPSLHPQGFIQLGLILTCKGLWDRLSSTSSRYQCPGRRTSSPVETAGWSSYSTCSPDWRTCNRNIYCGHALCSAQLFFKHATET